MNDFEKTTPKKKYIHFLTKFFLIFFLIYFFFKGVIALSSKDGGLYSSFVANYLDIVSFIKYTLVGGTEYLLSLFHIQTYDLPNYIIRIVNGKGVRIAHGCVGYGVFSFWLAYVLANPNSFTFKLFWSVSGILILWCINVIRISLLLLAINNNYAMPLGIDHHTWFNIVSYIFIFLMIFIFEKKSNTNK
jgi:exosortase/archaeosortase family protein